MHVNPVRGAVDSLVNGRGRSMQHLIVGLGLTAGAVALSALAARLYAPTPEEREVYSDYEEPEPPAAQPSRNVFAMIWPPLYMALTLSGLRIWNAPRRARRAPRR